MFQIVLFTDEERRRIIKRYGIEQCSREWVWTPETYPIKAFRKYLEGDEFGVYKKADVRMPFYLRRRYKKEKEIREQRIYIKFYKLKTNIRFGKKREYFMFGYGIEKLSETDIIEMRKLLEMG